MRVRQEEFGRLLVLAGLPMLCTNEDGTRIWDLCSGERTVAEIVSVCAQDYGQGGEAAVGVAVHDFLEEAVRLGLVSMEEARQA